MKVSTVEMMRELDRRAIEQLGIPGPILMEHAGHAVYEALQQRFALQGLLGRNVCVICGAGNNGGDGFVIARKAHSAGAKVSVLLLGSPDRFSDDARANHRMLEPLGLTVEEGPSAERLAALCGQADAIVDALFGTGLAREVSGRYREAIEAINGAEAWVVSVDIPSGVDGNSGAIHGVAVLADLTVTFGLPKQGNLLYPGAARGGQLWVSSISFPPALQQVDELQTWLELPPPLPPRRADGHKGSFGDGLVIAGAGSYYGAPMFAALALLRAGAGYARLAAPRRVCEVVAGLAPEVVFVAQDEDPQGGLRGEGATELLELAAGLDAVVLGPGLGLGDGARELTQAFVEQLAAPLVLDGDGLTAICDDPSRLVARPGPTVLTPHLGEMARLTGREVSAIQADPIGAAREFACRFEVALVLKGAHSLVALPDGRVLINPSGNHAMATAGSGDVLAGILGALLAGGQLGFADALRCGVFVHGLAGDLAAEALGADGVVARDILDHVPAALRRYREGYAELERDVYGACRRV
jgi:hydroxyethylthiazole kinase-like uncharacterized protein yjeF